MRARPLEDIFQAALDGLRDVLHVNRAALLLLDARGEMRFVAWRGISERYRRAVEGHSPWTPNATHPRPILVADVRTDTSLAPYRDAFENEGIRALAFIPLVAHGRLRGKFMLYYDTVHTFSEEEVRLAQIIARHLAFALEHWQAQQTLEERATYLQTLNTIIAAAAEANNLDHLLDVTLYHVGTSLDAPIGIISVGEHARVRGLTDACQEMLQRMTRYMSEYLTRTVVVDNAALLRERPAHGYLDILVDQLGVSSYVSVPIMARGQRIGVLSVAAFAPREWSHEAVTFLEAVGRQVGEALVRLRLLQHTEARARYATRLASLAETLNRPHTVADVLEAIGQAAMQLADVERAAIFVRDDDDVFHCRWCHGISRRHVETVSARLEDLPARVHLTSNEPLLIADVAQWPEDSLFRRLAEQEGFQALAAWPLVFEEKTVAAVVCYYDTPHTWDDVEQDTMAMFARQAAIALRNAQLLADLERTNTRLAEALEARDAMLRNVSHELRTPLTLVRGYAELLADESFLKDLDVQDAAGAILRNARHLEHLINQLFAFQRLKKEAEKREWVDVRAWLEGVVASWRKPLQEQGLTLTLQVEGEVGRVWAHPDFMNQVMYNLLDNARKFSPEGGTIRVRCWADDREVFVAVSDEGVGIPPDKLDRIFERFYQVDTTTKRRFGGMGLGLALVKEIVEYHGGRVWAESEGPGKGATIVFALPREEQTPAPNRSSQFSLPPENAVQ